MLSINPHSVQPPPSVPAGIRASSKSSVSTPCAAIRSLKRGAVADFNPVAVSMSGVKSSPFEALISIAIVVAAGFAVASHRGQTAPARCRSFVDSDRDIQHFQPIDRTGQIAIHQQNRRHVSFLAPLIEPTAFSCLGEAVPVKQILEVPAGCVQPWLIDSRDNLLAINSGVRCVPEVAPNASIAAQSQHRQPSICISRSYRANCCPTQHRLRELPDNRVSGTRAKAQGLLPMRAHTHSRPSPVLLFQFDDQFTGARLREFCRRFQLLPKLSLIISVNAGVPRGIEAEQSLCPGRWNSLRRFWAIPG